MAAKIETAFSFDASGAPDSPPQNTPPERRAHPPEVVDSSDHSADSVVSTVPQGLSDTDREQAICRAAALVEFFHAEYRCHEALWRKHEDFTSKSAFDLAYSNAHKARQLMESLIRGRSAEMVAYLERQRGLDLPACANEARG